MEAKPGSEAPRPSLKKLGGAFVGLLQGHLELVGIEVQEEKARTFRLFLLAGVSLILGLLVLVGLSAAIVIAFSITIVMLVLAVTGRDEDDDTEADPEEARS